MLRFAQHDVHPFLPCVVLAALVLPVVPACKEETRETPVPVTQYIRPDAAPTYSPPGNTIRVDVAFADVTASSGVRFQHTTGAFGKKWMPETMGGGGGFFDYNGDGLPDILLVNSTYWPGHEPNGASPHGRAPASRLFRNLGGGRFEDVSTAAGLAKLSCYGMGAAMADYDGDGDADVLLTAVGKNHLLRNDGGRFVDVTDAAGVGFSTCDGAASAWEWSTGAVWVDHDRDGDLDLFVANYVTWTPETDIWTTLDGKTKSYATPQQYAGATCVLFRNDGDGTFTDVTKPAGLFNADGKSMSVLTDDFNDDGWPDLVVTNDTQPNFLYINNTDGTFTDQALSAGVAYDENGLARAGMGVSATDLTNQGSRSIAIGNFSGEPLSLYTQTDGRTFVDLAGATRLSRPTNRVLSFGVLFADLNLDGFDDLLLANGHIEPSIAAVREGWTFAQPPQLFLNNR
ncbi:MAG: FG-GAP repeat domain-containing protein, partial [Phycisphaerae bacterium]